MAVTTQESSDGIREKAMRIASIDELETGSSTARWSNPGRAESDRTRKANELVISLVGMTKKAEDMIVASGSKSKQWRDMSLKRAIQNWNVKCVGIERSPGVSDQSVHQQSKTGKSVEDQRGWRNWRIGDEDRDAPEIVKLLKKNEMDVAKSKKLELLEKLVKRIETGGPQARK